MNTDLSIQLPNETDIEYYKRCRLVLEDKVKKLEAEIESLKCCGNCNFEAFDGEGCYNTNICENCSCWEKA